MIINLLTFLFSLHLTFAEFPLTCPSKPHWNFRAKIVCKNIDEYRCLWDVNHHRFTEQCGGIDEQRKGFRKVLEGGITAGDCTVNTYQPRKWTTKGNYDCEFQKSLCNEIGQTIYEDGDGITDRSCGCNHTAGYAFVTKPKNLCYCVPSVEDCSCYKKKCGPDQVVDPEYECRSIFRWKSWFSCKEIFCGSTGQSCGENIVGSSKFVLRSNTNAVSEKAIPYKYKAVIAVAVGILAFVIIGIGGVLFIVPYEKAAANMQKQITRKIEQDYLTEIKARETLERALEEKERQHQEQRAENANLKRKIEETEVIQQRKEKIKNHLSRWEKDETTFTETIATKHVTSLIDDNNIVTVTGSSGSGKSFLIHHVALKMKSQGYDIIPLVTSPVDIIQYRDIKRDQLFIIDDLCGKTNVDLINLKQWKTYIEKIRKLASNITPSKTQYRLKILVSCQLHIFKDKRFVKSLKLFTEQCVDLQSEKYRLLHKEKQTMAEKYNKNIKSDEVRQKSYKMLEDCHVEYFPLLCKMSKGKQVDQFAHLLSTPIDSIRMDIHDMVKTKPMDICALVLCVLSPDGFHEDSVDPKKRPLELRKKVADIIDAYHINPANDKQKVQLRKTFAQLDGTFVKKTGPIYSISHDKLYDILVVECCHSFKVARLYIQYGPSTLITERFRFKSVFQVQEQQLLIYLDEDVEAFYFKRIFQDLDGKIYQPFFKNRQLQEVKYQNKVMDYINQNKQSCDELFRRLDRDGIQELGKYAQSKNTYTSTPLIEGTKAGFHKLVEYLIDINCDLNQTDSKGFSPLWYSCKNGMTEVMKVIVKKGADSLHGDSRGWTPLTAACRWGHIEIVNMLSERMASLTRCDMRGQSPLTVACRYGHSDIVGLLLDRGVNPSQCDRQGHTPLTAACMRGHRNIVEILIMKKVSISQCGKDGMSPLMYACKGGHMEVVKLLLDRRADPLQKDKRGRTAIYYTTAWDDTIRNILKQHIIK